jgi:hypothetical protein
VPSVAQHLEALGEVTPIMFWACIVFSVIIGTMNENSFVNFVKYLLILVKSLQQLNDYA